MSGPLPPIAPPPFRGARRRSLRSWGNSLTAHSAAARQLTNTRLAQHIRAAKEFFKNSLSINTLAALLHNVEDEVHELTSMAAPHEDAQEANPSRNENEALGESNSAGPHVAGAQESRAEEHLASLGSTEESIQTSEEIASAAASSSNKASPFGALNGLAASLPPAGSADESTVQAQIIEAFNLGLAAIEYIDQYAALNESNAPSQDQTLAFIAQIDSRVQSLRSRIELTTQNRPLNATVKQRLAFIMSMLSFMKHLLKSGIRSNISTSALSNRASAKKLSKTKNKKLMRSMAALLKEELESKPILPPNRVFLRKQQEGGGGGESKDPKFMDSGGEDESSQEPNEKAHAPEPLVEGEQEEENYPSASDPVQREKFKNKQEKLFHHEAELLRKGLIEIFSENDIYLPEKYSDQILLFIIIDGLAVGTTDDSAYHYVLQNLMNRLPISKKITSFLKEKGRKYWKILQILKSLYLEDGMNLEEIEKNLAKHAKISHYEDKPAPAEMLKAAQI